MKENIEFRSLCPVATSLDVIGDKWTLLILRDMIWGHKTMFHEFKESPEKMPSKMLSNRLKKLESIGFISKQKGTVNKKNKSGVINNKLQNNTFAGSCVKMSGDEQIVYNSKSIPSYSQACPLAFSFLHPQYR